MRVSDGSGNSRYFDITPEQSLASGLPAYRRQGRRPFRRRRQQAALSDGRRNGRRMPILEYDRLVGDAADSPLVQIRGTPNQTTLGAGFTYSFDIAK